MEDSSEGSFAVVFKKLFELRGSCEASESDSLAGEADEIQELSRIIEEINTPSCVEFVST